MIEHWIVLNINPDPWAIGPLGVGRRNGKYFPYVGRNAQLDAFKQAVREELEHQGLQKVEYFTYALTFYFWRRLDSHASGKKHMADATNLQKATEDALQDVLIGNDRDVRDVRSVIVEQGDNTVGRIIIHLRPYTDNDVLETIPDFIWDRLDDPQPEALFAPENNVWRGPS